LITFQLLSCQVEIDHEDPAIADKLDYLVNRARQPIESRQTFRYEVRGTSPYEIREGGDLVGSYGTPDDVLYVIYSRVHRRVLERFVSSGWVVFHGAIARVKNRRLLILGEKASGKSTLAMRLMFAGHQVEGDEWAMERNGEVLAFPRNLHLKPGIEVQIPEMADHLDTLPITYMGDARISALDPSLLGFDWDITVGPVDEVIWLTANHGGETSLERRPPFDAIRKIIESALGWGETPEAVVAAASRLGGAGGIELVLGDAREGARLLESGPADSDGQTEDQGQGRPL